MTLFFTTAHNIPENHEEVLGKSPNKYLDSSPQKLEISAIKIYAFEHQQSTRRGLSSISNATVILEAKRKLSCNGAALPQKNQTSKKSVPAITKAVYKIL